MRWNCDKHGCYRQKCCPRLEEFKECFYREISPGDLDGIVEFRGKFWVLEWKTPGAQVKRAQELLFVAFTKAQWNIVFVAEGDCTETPMSVSRYQVYWDGKQYEWFRGDFAALKSDVTAWSNFVARGGYVPLNIRALNNAA
jgi:hypothetical protein